MSYIIKDYSKWKELNERYKAGETFGSRVVLISIDDSSFKIKAIKEIDIVDANNKMIPTGWAALRDNFLKTNIPASDPAVKKALDTKTNFIIYDVNKANDRKQVITFTVKPRTEAPGLPPTTEYVSQAELQTLIKDPGKATILAQASQSAETKAGTQVQTGAQTTAGPIKLAKPISLEAIKGADGKATYDDQGEVTGPPVFKAFDDMLVALSKMPEVAKNTAFINLKKEIKAGQLGDSAVTFAKALIVGFGLKDKYGDPLEIINQAFVDKLSTTFAKPAAPATAQNASRQYYLGLDGKAIYEADQTVVGGGQTNTPAPAPAAADSGFDMAAFLKALGGTDTGAVNTGDIKLPEGGIKKGVAAKGDAELKKAQQLIIDKLGAVLAKDPTFIKFKGYGADGNYGPTTEKIVAMAKAGFELKDTDGSVITDELINKLLTDKITESYIGLDGKLFEKFNVEAATSAGSSYVPKKSDTVKKDDTKKDDSPDATWFDNIKSNLETFGKLTVNTMTNGSKYYTLAPEGGDPDDYVNVFNNKRIIYPTKNQTYKGTVSADGTSITLDGGKKLALSAFLKNPAEAGSVDAAAEQGKQVWIASGNTEGFANVRMDSDSNNAVIYKHDDKSKSIGMLLGTTKDSKGYTWYTVRFPEAKNNYTQGRVRSDLVDLKAAK